MTTMIGRHRRAQTAVLTLVLAVSVLPVMSAPGSAADSDRVAGANRYATAAAVAASTFPDGATDVVLATGENFPDALAASGIAGVVGAPVLLTAAAALPDETRSALQALAPTTVHIAGGEVAVGQAVEDDLDAAGYATPRFAGGDRYETASMIAAAVGDDTAPETAIIATGEDFPDALAGGPLAYAGPHPILLVEQDAVPDATEQALEDLSISELLILGGPSAVSTDVEQSLEAITGDAVAERLAGQNRYETAAAIADHAVAHAGFSTETVLLANGARNMGVDALAGGPHGGRAGAPVLLVETDAVPAGTLSFLKAHASGVASVRALGGPVVISDSTLAAAVAAIGDQPLHVTPDDDVALELIAGTETAADADARDYEVANVDASVEHTIALFPADAVSVDSGAVSFLDDDGDGAADGLGQVGAEIVAVQNVTGTAYGQVARVLPVGDLITFRIDGAVNERIVPVVFIDADADGALDLDAENRPTVAEPVGVGGAIHYLAPEAADGSTATDEVPTMVDEANNVFADGDSSYAYDDNDTFLVGGVAATMSEFEQVLSAGDTVAVTNYQRDAALASTFDITSDVADAPTGLSVSVADHDSDGAADDAALSWTGAVNGRIATYTAAVDLDCDESGVFDDVTVTTADDSSQVRADSLPDGDHCAVVRATTAVGGNVTADSLPAAFSVDAVDEPTIELASLAGDAVEYDAVSSGDDWRFVFSHEMGADDVATWVFDVTDTDGDKARVACIEWANANDLMTDALCTLDDGLDDALANDTLTISILEDASDQNSGGDGILQYPVTVTATNAAVDDADNGAPVDVNDSSDTTLD